MIRSANLIRILIAAVLAAIAIAALPSLPSAQAHDQLIDSTPVEGSSLETAPSEAVLRFSGNVLDLGTELALVRDADQQVLDFPAPFALSPATVTQPLPALDAGAYTLNWRVVSEDGHPITGSVHFTVTGGADAGSASEPVPTAVATAVETGEPGTAPTEGQVPWATILFGIGGLAVAGAAVALFVVRMRRGPGPRWDQK